MNVDALINAEHPTWERMQQLSKQRRLTAAEAEELLDCYRRTGVHLSRLATYNTDPAATTTLSAWLLNARCALTGSAEPFGTELRHFFTVALPTALWRLRWLSLAVAAISCLIAFAVGAYIAGNRELQYAMLSDSDIKQLVEHDFEAYYHQGHAVGFFGQVWLNNAWLCMINVVTGVLGFPAVMSVIFNAINVAHVGGIMHAHGGQATFWSLILPHGLLEITCLFVSAAAGLRLCWAWVSAGRGPRLITLAQEGRALLTVAVGLIIALFVSGIIEAFVTPAPWPTAIRITIGAIALAAFWVYSWYFGRRSELAGQTGDMRRTQRGSVTIYQA